MRKLYQERLLANAECLGFVHDSTCNPIPFCTSSLEEMEVTENVNGKERTYYTTQVRQRVIDPAVFLHPKETASMWSIDNQLKAGVQMIDHSAKPFIGSSLDAQSTWQEYLNSVADSTDEQLDEMVGVKPSSPSVVTPASPSTDTINFNQSE